MVGRGRIGHGIAGSEKLVVEISHPVIRLMWGNRGVVGVGNTDLRSWMVVLAPWMSAVSIGWRQSRGVVALRQGRARQVCVVGTVVVTALGHAVAVAGGGVRFW